MTWDGLQADVIDSEHDVLLMLYKPHGRFLTNEDKVSHNRDRSPLSMLWTRTQEENLIRIVAKDLEQMTGMIVPWMSPIRSFPSMCNQEALLQAYLLLVWIFVSIIMMRNLEAAV